MHNTYDLYRATVKQVAGLTAQRSALQAQIAGLIAERAALREQLAAVVAERDALRAENETYDAALEDAYTLQDCGHPGACIATDDEGASWCEACVMAAARLPALDGAPVEYDATCQRCGSVMEQVRPGRWQCNRCEATP
jgi:ribosomal protein S27AE